MNLILGLPFSYQHILLEEFQKKENKKEGLN